MNKQVQSLCCHEALSPWEGKMTDLTYREGIIMLGIVFMFLILCGLGSYLKTKGGR